MHSWSPYTCIVVLQNDVLANDTLEVISTVGMTKVTDSLGTDFPIDPKNDQVTSGVAKITGTDGITILGRDPFGSCAVTELPPKDQP